MSLCVLFRPEKTCPFYLYSVVVKKLLDLGADQSLEGEQVDGKFYFCYL